MGRPVDIETLLKAELERRKVGYGELAICLRGIGVYETEAELRRRFTDGDLPLRFSMQCLEAVGCPTFR
jgi:hypothetical protein